MEIQDMAAIGGIAITVMGSAFGFYNKGVSEKFKVLKESFENRTESLRELFESKLEKDIKNLSDSSDLADEKTEKSIDSLDTKTEKKFDVVNERVDEWIRDTRNMIHNIYGVQVEESNKLAKEEGLRIGKEYNDKK